MQPRTVLWLVCFFPVGVYFLVRDLKGRKNTEPHDIKNKGGANIDNNADVQTPLASIENNSKSDFVSEDQVQDVSASDNIKDIDFDKLFKPLGIEEKFCLLVGLLALYGDGNFSEKEIAKLREIIASLDFKPRNLVHRDPTDNELCLDEKVAWTLNLIKSSFQGTNDFTREDVPELFRALTISLEKSIENDSRFAKTDRNGAYVDRGQYIKKIKKSLIDIAEADGTISDGERELINSYKAASSHHIGWKLWLIIIFLVLGLLSAFDKIF